MSWKASTMPEKSFTVENYVVPPPPVSLDRGTITSHKIRSGSKWHRVHANRYGAAEFNPGKGNARFSPIFSLKGTVVPTIYAAATVEGAMMESIYHDVPFHAGQHASKTVFKDKLQDQSHSVVTVGEDLNLADLGTKPLHRLGVSRLQLIESDIDQYPLTRAWAAAIHAAAPQVQGLTWMSRQDDSSRAIMLFGDRVKKGALSQVGSSRHLLDDDKAYQEVQDLAGLLGVRVVPRIMP
jgi:hypothetical protein